MRELDLTNKKIMVGFNERVIEFTMDPAKLFRYGEYIRVEYSVQMRVRSTIPKKVMVCWVGNVYREQVL